MVFLWGSLLVKMSALSLQVAVETIKDTLDKLPGYPRTQIGFVTFDSTLHFYNLKVGSLQLIFPLHLSCIL